MIINNENDNNFKKLDGEGVIDYVVRLSDMKRQDKDITWQFIADRVYIEFGLQRSESWARRVVKDALDLTTCSEEQIVDRISEQQAQLDETYRNMRKERVKLSDERTQINAYYRSIAREETIKEIALLAAQEMSNKKLLPAYADVKSTDEDLLGDRKQAILCISDWHYGLDFENPWNKFNPDICKNRVSKLLHKTIEKIKQNKCKRLHLCNLGDLIAGRIHLGIRLQSRFDVISQTMQVSEILSEFITELTKHVDVDYYDVIDNHSRIEPNKKDSMDLETLARIIPWYLSTRLKDNKRFTLHENTFGCDLSTFSVLGHKVIGVHGDKDKPITVIDHLSMMTAQHYDLVLTAHLHHYSCDEKNKTVAVSNSSLMGVDDFAQKLRLSATPSQNLIIVSKENVVDSIHRIIVE